MWALFICRSGAHCIAGGSTRSNPSTGAFPWKKAAPGSKWRILMLTRTEAIISRNLPSARRAYRLSRWPQERALVGADLHLNRVELVSPTIKQCAYLAGVCVTYVAAAVAIADDQSARAAVLAGDCTILEAAKAVAPETLAEHFARSSPKKWREAARMVGPAAVWDHMIAPLV